ncbi:MAG: helix-turn-helix domain-containing protein [Oscillospiraceae bacterium]|nr:helix-turn-helix domain-containing protein [Oscillospiraceae bacterium]
MNRIRELRNNKGILQEELAKLLQISQGTLSYWENGKYEPDNDSLKKLADYFSVSIDYLLNQTDNPTPPDGKSAIDDNGLKFALWGRTDIDDDVLEDVQAYAAFAAKRKRERENEVSG